VLLKIFSGVIPAKFLSLKGSPIPAKGNALVEKEHAI
jgi:hypothetical protein